MVTITIAHPNRNAHRKWQVFGTHEDEEDRFIFGLKEFADDQQEAAEQYSREMVEQHEADHLERLA